MFRVAEKSVALAGGRAASSSASTSSSSFLTLNGRSAKPHPPSFSCACRPQSFPHDPLLCPLTPHSSLRIPSLFPRRKSRFAVCARCTLLTTSPLLPGDVASRVKPPYDLINPPRSPCSFYLRQLLVSWTTLRAVSTESLGFRRCCVSWASRVLQHIFAVSWNSRWLARELTIVTLRTSTPPMRPPLSIHLRSPSDTVPALAVTQHLAPVETSAP